MMPKLEEFFEEVRFSLEGCAERKNYKIGSDNPVLAFKRALGITQAHGIGEIAHKCAEYLTAPTKTRKIILAKMCGWAYLLYSQLPDE